MKTVREAQRPGGAWLHQVAKFAANGAEFWLRAPTLAGLTT